MWANGCVTRIDPARQASNQIADSAGRIWGFKADFRLAIWSFKVLIARMLTTTTPEPIKAGSTTRSLQPLGRGPPQQMTFLIYRTQWPAKRRVVIRRQHCLADKQFYFRPIYIKAEYFRCLRLALHWRPASQFWRNSKPLLTRIPYNPPTSTHFHPAVGRTVLDQSCQVTHQLDSTTDFLSHSVTEFSETT